MYDVFISYSRADYQDKAGNIIPGNPVSKVIEALDSAGITYWFDSQRVSHGDDFAEIIVNNIESSEVFIFLSTVNSNKSPWTRKEIASAHQFGKKIIPVKIDDSHYDKAVMFRIVDLDYIDYGRNPDKAVEELVDTVNGLLSEKREAERRQKEEEERRRKEKEQRLKKAVADIELQSEKLKNEVFRLKLDHKLLLLNAQRVEDEQERSRLTALVQDSLQLEDKDKEAEQSLKSTIQSLSEENARLTGEMVQMKKALASGPGKVVSDDRRPIPGLIRVLVIIALVVSCLVAIFFFAAICYDDPTITLGALISIFAAVAVAGLSLVLMKRLSGFFVFCAGVLAVGCILAADSGTYWPIPIILALVVMAAAFGLLKMPVKGTKTWDLLKK